MASDQHQLLMRILYQKMLQEGFQITHWDGLQSSIVGGGIVPLPAPPKVGIHRPDLVGYNKKSCKYGFGEAKTLSDLRSARSEKQFRDFSSVLMTASGKLCDLYVAVPISAMSEARKLLVKCRLHGRKNVHLIKVPDVLVGGGGSNYNDGA